ncbi:SDR family oxidoreductase [Candidimonas sp. SYP-B2681]|uniref:SDR family NAD(P)-dependent oxidoreductase n=1 Tax=Candidimonas sp. SYP-B2681 TaxID=2497686 RepID=UPI000F85D18F|nr:SDR family NAD(P)-dependent oxidoreductase [Candidimonas sp. SYP-B2681]RTZ48217.1 SDR family oxidoreductase [Candidimonas sp. SYP-B2681]
MFSLKNKVAFIIGAGSVGPGWGNGRATATLLARQGAKVFALDKSPQALEETIRIIREEGGEVEGAVCDATIGEEIHTAIEACVKRFGRLDILVNNIGGSQPGGVEQLSEDDWDAQINYNLKSVYLSCKHAMPYLKQSPGSAIVNVSSVAALRMMKARPHSAYSAAKYGVIALSRSIAIQNAPAGVRCNTVIPGLMNTPVVEHRLVKQLGSVGAQELIANRDAQIPLGKAGTGWDIAHAVLFLVSDEAGHITGTELLVDGGYTAAAA